jgi:hypothetical protein
MRFTRHAITHGIRRGRARAARLMVERQNQGCRDEIAHFCGGTMVTYVLNQKCYLGLETQISQLSTLNFQLAAHAATHGFR